nr:hypothetical protein [Tanacetum cinerariifolium]
MTESVLKSAKKKTGSGSSRSVVIQDTLSAPNPKPATLMPKLKGTEGSSEGTGTIPGVFDESTIISAPSSEGTGAKLGVLDEEKEGDVDDEGDDHISDTQDTDDEDTKIKYDEDEIYKYKIRMRKDENVEMTNAEVEDFEKATPATTLPHLSISTIPPAPLKQTTAPIHPPPITTDSPIITSIVPNSDALSVVQLRVAKLEKDEQAEKHKMPKYTIKSTDKAALKESFDRDENVINKGVADTVKDHKRKHDDDDDDDDNDDENPPVGPNQGKKIKRSRTKESKSSKKPSTTKETPKDKAPSKGSKTSKSVSTKEPVEELNFETAKTSNPEWFTQPPRPPTLDLEWNKRQVVLGQPKQPLFNEMVSATKDPVTFNDLMPLLLTSLSSCTSNIELEYNFQEYFKALIDKLDWNNLEEVLSFSGVLVVTSNLTCPSTSQLLQNLHPRLPDPGFTMDHLPDGAIGIYSEFLWFFGIRNWFSFSQHHNMGNVCMDDGPSSLKKWKDKFFLIDRRDILDYLTWRHSCSCVSNDLPTDEMSIYDFMTLLSWGDAKVVEESHHLCLSLLECVLSHTTAPATEGAMILFPTPDEIFASLLDPCLANKSKGPSQVRVCSASDIAPEPCRPSKKRKLRKRASKASSIAPKLCWAKDMDDVENY